MVDSLKVDGNLQHAVTRAQLMFFFRQELNVVALGMEDSLTKKTGSLGYLSSSTIVTMA